MKRRKGPDHAVQEFSSTHSERADNSSVVQSKANAFIDVPTN